MATHAQGCKIKQPLYTGSFTVTTIGAYVYMHLLTSGTLTMQSKGEYDLFAVGGGGGGGYPSSPGENEEYSFAAGGGGGGYTGTRLAVSLAKGISVPVTIGSGGGQASDGGNTAFVADNINMSAFGGKGIGFGKFKNYTGANGGSGGGAAEKDDRRAGAGGYDGGNGMPSLNGTGGIGQGTTTKSFSETNGTLYAGGGGGGNGVSYSPLSAGGAGGGGNGGWPGSAGTINTGGGGGGGSFNSALGKSGGSGIAIIRWAA